MIERQAEVDHAAHQKQEHGRGQGEFRRDLPGSDALHWGEGRVYVGRDSITFEGELAPGPDYKLYLSPEYVETIEEFERARPNMLRVGDVKTFGGFLVPLPAGVDVAVVDGRHRPGATCSAIASRARAFSSPSRTAAVPSTTTER